MAAMSVLNRAIAEKRRLMYERYGGIMSPTDVAKEHGTVLCDGEKCGAV